MNIKIGDQVSVLDEDMSGKVVALSSDTISLETEDGFVIEFNRDQVVKMDHSNELLFSTTNKDALTESLEEDHKVKKRRNIKTSKKERFQPTMEIDLHIHKLLDSSKGMTKHDILTYQLDTARHKIEFAIQKKIQRVVFIHGVGEGVLKMELDYLLGRYDNVNYYDADYQKYGVGATEVYILQNAKRH